VRGHGLNNGVAPSETPPATGRRTDPTFVATARRDRAGPPATRHSARVIGYGISAISDDSSGKVLVGLGAYDVEVNDDEAPTGVPIGALPEHARAAWLALRDELRRILGDDLVAIWAHGGTTVVADEAHAADLDTYVIVGRRPDAATAVAVEEVHVRLARDHGIDWDTWYILEAAARRPDQPRHAYRENSRDTAWAIGRAHWLAGRFATIHGPSPAEMVPVPTWDELQVELSREVEHLERHVVEGDSDPYEASFAMLNGSRVVRAVETGDVVISKRAAATWALEHLPDRWHAALRAAERTYLGHAKPGDHELIAAEQSPFVAFVRERLPWPDDRPAGALPRWSGY
jgi:hypothetical protein